MAERPGSPCGTCGYDVTGAPRDGEGRVRCAECGDPDASRPRAVSRLPSVMLSLGVAFMILGWVTVPQIDHRSTKPAFILFVIATVFLAGFCLYYAIRHGVRDVRQGGIVAAAFWPLSSVAWIGEVARWFMR